MFQGRNQEILPKTNNEHFSVKKIYLKKKKKPSIFYFIFLEFQQLRNKYCQVHIIGLCSFNTHLVVGTIHNISQVWEFDSQQF